MTTILAFSGRKQSGKDTSANFLLDLAPDKVKLYSFAYQLKRVAHEVFGLTKEQCWGNNESKDEFVEHVGMTARQLMQRIGDVFRKIDPDVWVKSCLNQIKAEKLPFAIITDCRFPNEVRAVKKAGGKVIRFTRAPFADQDNHKSETALSPDRFDQNKFDAIILNGMMTVKQQNMAVLNTLKDFGSDYNIF